MATTIKLPAELKDRVAAVAQKKGKSPHAFMLEAIASRTEQEEQRQAFIGDALEAREESEESGKVYAAEDVHRYLDAKLKGEKVARPKATKWRK